MRQTGIAEVDEGYQKRLAEALVLYQRAADMASHTQGT